MVRAISREGSHFYRVNGIGVPLISEKRSQIDFNGDKIRDVT